MSPHDKALGSLRLAVLLLLLTLTSPRVAPAPAAAEVTSVSGGTGFQWTTGYALVQHPIPESNAEPWSVATDPHGNVWFVEQGTDQLGEYVPSTGAFVQHQIPTARSTPDAVASDSSGNIWFTELTSNKLGELPAGGSSMVEYPIPGIEVSLGSLSQPLGCGPGAVLAAPSGVIWVACLFSNQIDEFTPAQGTFARFDLPVFQSAPAGLVLDGKGDLWFTAADSNMLGKAVISQLRNGTDSGITEFAPLNQTYVYTYNHQTSFLGGSDVITSSIGTPSGIVIDSSGRLWVTEHVDTSFDSYDPATRSLVKYWNTQTFGAYGYTVTFPNGIAIAPDGDIWIGEHYGNRIAEFIPTAGVMTEYPVQCCNTTIAGVYSVALGPDGRLWYVEIGGEAIGEVVPDRSAPSLSLSLPQSSFELGADGTATVPLTFAEASGSPEKLGLNVSGITATGALSNMTARFTSSRVTLAPGTDAHTDLTLTLQGLAPGTYYLTLGATSQSGVVYSAILKLTVTSGSTVPPSALVPAAVAAVVVGGAAGLFLSRRSRGRRVRRRPLRLSLTSSNTKAPPPKVATTT